LLLFLDAILQENVAWHGFNNNRVVSKHHYSEKPNLLPERLRPRHFYDWNNNCRYNCLNHLLRLYILGDLNGGNINKKEEISTSQTKF